MDPYAAWSLFVWLETEGCVFGSRFFWKRCLHSCIGWNPAPLCTKVPSFIKTVIEYHLWVASTSGHAWSEHAQWLTAIAFEKRQKRSFDFTRCCVSYVWQQSTQGNLSEHFYNTQIFPGDTCRNNYSWKIIQRSQKETQCKLLMIRLLCLAALSFFN